MKEKEYQELIDFARKGVDEFHRKFNEEGLTKIEEVEDFINLRSALFAEELLEYQKAGANIIEKADAVTDMLYIAVGTIDLVSKSVEEVQYYINDEYRKALVEPLQVTLIALGVEEDVIIKLKIKELFQEVQKSNMSKLDDLGRPIINGVSVYDGNNKTIYDIEHVKGEVIQVDDKPLGKIIKSFNFIEPNIMEILNM